MRVPNAMFLCMFQADEPSEDAAIMDDYIKSTAPEEGFKGRYQ